MAKQSVITAATPDNVASIARRPDPPPDLPPPAAELWSRIARTRPPEYFDAANQELLAMLCRALAEHRKLAAIVESLDPVKDVDLYAKLTRASDMHARRVTQCATRLRLAKNTVMGADVAGRTGGDHRTPAERMVDRYRTGS